MAEGGPNDERSESNQQPQPSIYDRLMPLMYALIGAASAMFLHTLFCGRPVASRSARCKCPATRRQSKEAPQPKEAPRPRAAAADPAPPGAEATPAAVPEAADRPDTAVPAASRPAAAKAAEERIAAVIQPCVRARARSFRLAVRLGADAKVRRVFVARDTGVNSRMIECITGTLMDKSLAPERTRRGYAEWRVRQDDGRISLTQVRPRPLVR